MPAQLPTCIFCTRVRGCGILPFLSLAANPTTRSQAREGNQQISSFAAAAGGEDELAKFANTMIHDHNKVLEHHDESSTLSLETIMEKVEDGLKWAFKDDVDAEEKAQKIVTKIKGGMHYKQLQKPTPLIDYITPDCDRTAENPHAAASPFRAMRRSEEGHPKALAIAPRDDPMEQLD